MNRTRFHRSSRVALGLSALVLVGLVAGPARAEDEKQRSYTISPNERIHVIQRKVDLLEERLELTIYPVSAQINSRWTQHLGLGAGAAYHLTETFALQLLGGMNLYIGQETDLQDELTEKAQLAPNSAPSIITRGYGFLSAEVSPFYGKLGFYENAMMGYALFLTAGVGVVDSAVQLIPRVSPSEGGRGLVRAASGLWPAGIVGAGFRVMISNSIAVRLEVRDLVYSPRVTHINGCSASDLGSLATTNPQISKSCNYTKFDQDFLSQDAARAARKADGSSKTVNQVSAFLGMSYLF